MDWSSGICLFNKDPRWSLRLPRWHGGKESACHCRRCRRHGFSPWVGRSSEGEMATHSSILAWKIPWTEEPGGLQSMRSQTAGHNWVTEHTHTPGDLHACGLWTTLFKTILTSKPPIPCNHLDFCSISSQPTSYVFADLYSNSYRDSVQQSKADFSLKVNLLQCQNYLACWTSLWQKCTLMTLLWRMLNLAWVVFCVMETPLLLLL